MMVCDDNSIHRSIPITHIRNPSVRRQEDLVDTGWKYRSILPRSKNPGGAIAQGETGKARPVREKRMVKYAYLDCIRRMRPIPCTGGEMAGIPIEWKASPEAEDCARRVLKIRTLTNSAHPLLDGKQERHKSRPSTGRNEILEWIQKIRFGILLINTEVCPLAKRARIALEAARKSRLGKMQIKGKKQKQYMRILGDEAEQGKAELVNGGMSNIFETAANKRGLTRTQYRDWRKEEGYSEKEKRACRKEKWRD